MTSPWRSGSPCTAPTHGCVHLGTKTGCRRLFAEEGVRHPLGHENLHDLDEVADAVVSMRQHGARCAEVIVKLNEGVSGQGNALVDLRDLPPARRRDRSASRSSARLRQMQFERPDTAARRLPEQACRAGRHRRGAHLRASRFAARACSYG